MTAAGFERALAAVRGSGIAVDEDFCINLRGRGILCRRCEKACPAAALTLSADAVTVAEDECTDCGACVPACPTGVFRLPVFDPERFLDTLDGRDEVHLHCGESRDPVGGVVVPCHLLMDARLVAAAFADGVTRFTFHGTGGCEDCPRGDARPHIDRLRRALGRWFGDRAPKVVTAMAETATSGGRAVRHDQVTTDRRGFLRAAALRTAAGVAWLVPVAEEEEDENEFPAPWRMTGLSRRPVAWRRALWRRLAELPWAGDKPLPWHVRSFDESCSGCMACAERCPTGALEGTADESARSISFDPSLCTNCTLCQRICPQDSVRPRLARDLAEACAPRGLLFHIAQRPCPQCGGPIVAGPNAGALCSACLNEQEMDEEWLALLES